MSASDVDRAIDGYEAAVQRQFIEMAGKVAELRELLDTALDVLTVIGRHEGGSAQRVIMAEVEAMRAAADAIQSRDQMNDRALAGEDLP